MLIFGENKTFSSSSSFHFSIAFALKKIKLNSNNLKRKTEPHKIFCFLFSGIYLGLANKKVEADLIIVIFFFF